MTTLALAVGAALLAAAVPAKPRPEVPSAPKVSGPYRHENLDVYLIHGPDTGAKHKWMTLGEALAQKKVIVRETQTVSQLTIENLSADGVYVQAGDIVKGGQQDRVLSVDLVLPPRSGRVDVAAFCVEHGRWQGRGRERVDRFETSTANLAHKDLKIANYAGSQQGVWSSVDQVQNQLAQNVGGAVRGRESPTSLQLTLENEKVKKSIAAHVKALRNLSEKHPDAVGYAFAVNGVLSGAEVYASRGLFRALWPKLLEASAVEAVAETNKAKGAPVSPTTDEVVAFLADTADGAATEKSTATGTTTVVRDSTRRVFAESQQKGEEGWIHRGYVRK